MEEEKGVCTSQDSILYRNIQTVLVEVSQKQVFELKVYELNETIGRNLKREDIFFLFIS